MNEQQQLPIESESSVARLEARLVLAHNTALDLSRVQFDRRAKGWKRKTQREYGLDRYRRTSGHMPSSDLHAMSGRNRGCSRLGSSVAPGDSPKTALPFLTAAIAGLAGNEVKLLEMLSPVTSPGTPKYRSCVAEFPAPRHRTKEQCKPHET